MLKTIGDVITKNLCTGCCICTQMFESAAIMEIDPDGFLRPRTIRELDSTEIKLFNSVCPGVYLSHASHIDSFVETWGPVREVTTGYATDDEVRFRGSSGGIISALAIHLLETQQVRGVLHIVSSDKNPFENIAQISCTREDVIHGAGSRYAPAAPLSLLSECLKQEGQFAFIGKPCDVAALKSLGRSRPEIEMKFPFSIAFMCAGTPSLHGTIKVVQAMGFNSAEISKFRYRGNGWPGKARAETQDGRFSEMDYNTSWGEILGRYQQFRCKICPDGTGEFADVSCADAWNTNEKGYPVFTENAGCSLVIARTETGLQLIKDAEKHNKITLTTCTLANAEKMQPYQVHRKRTLLARLVGFKLAFKAVPTYRNMGLFVSARKISFFKQLKAILGSWVRGLKDER